MRTEFIEDEYTLLTSKKYGSLKVIRPSGRQATRKKPKKKKQKVKIFKQITSILQAIIPKPPKRKKVTKSQGHHVTRKKPIRRKKFKEKKPKAVEAKPKEAVIGEITHFFPHVNAAVIKLKQALVAGDTVHIKGTTTDFIEQVDSMQADNKPIKKAKKGDEIGLLVKEKVRAEDVVYKVKG